MNHADSERLNADCQKSKDGFQQETWQPNDGDVTELARNGRMDVVKKASQFASQVKAETFF